MDYEEIPIQRLWLPELQYNIIQFNIVYRMIGANERTLFYAELLLSITECDEMK